jgi:hypothetical protein
VGCSPVLVLWLGGVVGELGVLTSGLPQQQQEWEVVWQLQPVGVMELVQVVGLGAVWVVASGELALVPLDWASHQQLVDAAAEAWQYQQQVQLPLSHPGLDQQQEQVQ